MKLEAEYDTWNERLELMIAALAELHEQFLVLCPSVTPPPWTRAVSIQATCNSSDKVDDRKKCSYAGEVLHPALS